MQIKPNERKVFMPKTEFISRISNTHKSNEDKHSFRCRLLSKSDENIFQSVINTSKPTETIAHELSSSAISDVRLIFD